MLDELYAAAPVPAFGMSDFDTPMCNEHVAVSGSSTMPLNASGKPVKKRGPRKRKPAALEDGSTPADVIQNMEDILQNLTQTTATTTATPTKGVRRTRIKLTHAKPSAKSKHNKGLDAYPGLGDGLGGSLVPVLSHGPPPANTAILYSRADPCPSQPTRANYRDPFLRLWPGGSCMCRLCLGTDPTSNKKNSGGLMNQRQKLLQSGRVHCKTCNYLASPIDTDRSSRGPATHPRGTNAPQNAANSDSDDADDDADMPARKKTGPMLDAITALPNGSVPIEFKCDQCRHVIPLNDNDLLTLHNVWMTKRSKTLSSTVEEDADL